jgi:hypothetical protein
MMVHLGTRSSRAGGWRRHVLALVFFAVVLGVVYSPVLLGHASLKTNSNWPPGPLFVIDPSAGGYISLPLEKLGLVAWSHLQLPVLDPYQGYGIPLLATQGVPVFLPELIVHLLAGSNYSLWNLIRLLVLAFGTYLLASSFGQSMVASITAGIAVSFAGVTPPNTNLEMLNPLMVLPFVLLSLRYLLDPAKPRKALYALGLITSVFMLAISGFQEALPLLAVVIVIFGVAMVVHFHTLADRLRLWLALGGGIAGVVIGAIGLLPTLSAVRAGMGETSPQRYLGAVPRFWLATLSLPHIQGTGLVVAPTDLGQATWVFGSPVLVLVLVLAVFGVVRHHRASLWYVGPSLVIVVFGILGYANIFGVLSVFRFFPFNSINMLRVLGFGWWLPWCLLAGFVISIARTFKVYEVITSLAVATVVDLVLYKHFTAALRAAHVAGGVSTAHHGLLLAIAVMVAFAVGIVLARLIAGGVLVALVFVAVTILLVPTNFFPAQAGISLNRVRGHAIATSDVSTFNPGEWQLPTEVNSVQVFGPILPKPYSRIIAALLPPKLTVTGLNGVNVGQPTLFGAQVTSHLVQILRSLGVNEIASTQSFAPTGISSVPPCSAKVATAHHDFGLCYLGTGSFTGGHRVVPNALFELKGVDPLVAPSSHIVRVSSNAVGLHKTLVAIASDGGVLPRTVTITAHEQLPRPAQGLIGIRRSATTESVVLRARAKSQGLAVLRDTYLSGMHCLVNKRPVTCYPVDGGLWTGVSVPAGVFTATLDYVSTSVHLEFAVAVAGSVILAIGWIGLLVLSLRRRLVGAGTLTKGQGS